MNTTMDMARIAAGYKDSQASQPAIYHDITCIYNTAYIYMIYLFLFK